jgi:hypothetical protein
MQLKHISDQVDSLQNFKTEMEIKIQELTGHKESLSKTIEEKND